MLHGHETRRLVCYNDMRKPKDDGSTAHQATVVPPLVEFFYRQLLLDSANTLKKSEYEAIPSEILQCSDVNTLIQKTSKNKEMFNREMGLLVFYVCLKNSTRIPLFDCVQILAHYNHAQKRIKLSIKYNTLLKDGRCNVKEKDVTDDSSHKRKTKAALPPHDNTRENSPCVLLLTMMLPHNVANTMSVVRSLRKAGGYSETLYTGFDIASAISTSYRASKWIFIRSSPFFLNVRNQSMIRYTSLLSIQMSIGRLLYKKLAIESGMDK